MSSNIPIKIIVQTEDFSLADEYNHLLHVNEDENTVGAVTTFVGLVRADKSSAINVHEGQNGQSGQNVQSMTLEHYPQMTEKSLTEIANSVNNRFDILAITIIHRVGKLCVGEQIVLVGVASSHRSEAFAACEMLIDYLKTSAPFWKKEENNGDSSWVEAKSSDEKKLTKWVEKQK